MPRPCPAEWTRELPVGVPRPCQWGRDVDRSGKTICHQCVTCGSVVIDRKSPPDPNPPES